MRFYVSLFPGARIDFLERYGADGPGKEGTVFQGRCTLAGQAVRFTDSFVKHDFTFTPAMSLFVDCADETELDRLFEKLSVGGKVMMPPNNYGFSARFAWVADRFGVSWQLNLPVQ